MRRTAWLLTLLAACDRDEIPPPASDALLLGPADVVTVERGTLATGPRLSGRLEPAAQARLTAEAAGSVVRVTVDVGDDVTVGQVLVRIEAPTAAEAVASARSAVAQGRAQVEAARREVERARRLFEGGAVSRRDVETAETTLATQQASLAAAEAQLAVALEQQGTSVVVSPLNGSVSERAVADGDVVAPGSPLLTVVDPSSLRLVAGIPPAALGLLEIGTQVKFEVQGIEGRTFVGIVERISPAVDPATGQIPVHVTFPNPERTLPAGLFAEGRLLAATAGGLVVPTAALEKGPPASVDRVVGGRVEVVEVTVVAQDAASERAEVTGALSVGDVVLVGVARESATHGTLVELRAEP